MTNSPDLKVKIDSIDSHVSKRLRTRRIMLGLSQKTLAEAVDVSIQQIQKYEKSTNRISSGKLYSLANLLKVPVSYFFEKLGNTEYSNVSSASVFAESQEGFLVDEIIPEKEVISLIKAFNEIRDLQVRRKIIDLVKSLRTTI